jgi:hypothetical protein
LKDDLARAVKLSLLPGVTLAEAARRTGVSLAALRRAKKAAPANLTRDDLILAALTKNGEQREGTVGDLASLASFIDYLNHDGSTAAGVENDLRRLASEGRIALAGARFRLLARWP